MTKRKIIILPLQLELKSIHKILNKKIKPICQIKWEALYGEDVNWEQVWSKLKQVHVWNKIKQCQWKCIHNIIYTESRLQKMNMSNGKCHLCQVNNNNQTLQHLFFQWIRPDHLYSIWKIIHILSKYMINIYNTTNWQIYIESIQKVSLVLLLIYYLSDLFAVYYFENLFITLR